jgi:hypothetical protein
MSQLIFPRVSVSWGNQNLTSFTGGTFVSEPLVYDVSVDLAMDNNNPTGSFKWNPSGAAYTIYQQLLKSSVNQIITVKFYYEGGKSISFEFVWAGHQDIYGNDNTITVKLRSQLDGLINSAVRSTTQNYDQGAPFLTAIKKYGQQYGIKDNIVFFEKKAATDLQKATLENAYRESETYGSAVANLAKQNGNITFANNINKANLVIFTPFTWKPNASDVVEPMISGPVTTAVQRYGYLLGPGIINSIERSLEWSPPQQESGANVSKQPLPVPSSPPAGVKEKQTSVEQSNKQAQAPGAVVGPSSAKPNPGVRNQKNADGPIKQILLQKESQSKLSASVFACPSLMGIKPLDIVYVPSLRTGAPYIEDWIVETVAYQQTAGGVEISIGGTRIFTQEGLMNAPAGAKFQQKAASLNKNGRAGLDEWQKYAWALPFNQ